MFDKHSKLFDALSCSIEITNIMKYHYMLRLYYVIYLHEYEYILVCVDIDHGIFVDIKETITTQCHLSITWVKISDDESIQPRNFMALG